MTIRNWGPVRDSMRTDVAEVDGRIVGDQAGSYTGKSPEGQCNRRTLGTQHPQRMPRSPPNIWPPAPATNNH
jgi:hypothetical protein